MRESRESGCSLYFFGPADNSRSISSAVLRPHPWNYFVNSETQIAILAKQLILIALSRYSARESRYCRSSLASLKRGRNG
jgi:hypothetical protein